MQHFFKFISLKIFQYLNDHNIFEKFLNLQFLKISQLRLVFSGVMRQPNAA
jgi:hypothetical protein